MKKNLWNGTRSITSLGDLHYEKQSKINIYNNFVLNSEKKIVWFQRWIHGIGGNGNEIVATNKKIKVQMQLEFCSLCSQTDSPIPFANPTPFSFVFSALIMFEVLPAMPRPL